MTTKCKQCGRNVPRRAGFIKKADPSGYFCTMRCAVLFAVENAEQDSPTDDDDRTEQDGGS